MEPFVIQRSALLFQGWQPNFQKWLQNFDFAASNFFIDPPLTSMASKTALHYISKIASNQCICSKDWWELWIVGRDCKKPKVFSSEVWRWIVLTQLSKNVRWVFIFIMNGWILFFYMRKNEQCHWGWRSAQWTIIKNLIGQLSADCKMIFLDVFNKKVSTKMAIFDSISLCYSTPGNFCWTKIIKNLRK